MKTLFLAAGALLASAPAFAQDAAPAAPTAGGFYVGAHAGYGWTRPDYEEPGFSTYGRNPSVDGFTAGILAGYDFSAGNILLGLEGDIGLLGGDESNNEDAVTNDYTAFDNKWNAHVRVRAGLPVGRAKLFVAGGLALARIEADDTDDGWGSFERTFTGWTLGAGADYALGSKLSVRAEYLHDEFGKKNGEIELSGGSSSYDVSLNPKSDLVRVAILYAL